MILYSLEPINQYNHYAITLANKFLPACVLPVLPLLLIRLQSTPILDRQGLLAIHRGHLNRVFFFHCLRRDTLPR